VAGRAGAVPLQSRRQRAGASLVHGARTVLLTVAALVCALVAFAGRATAQSTEVAPQGEVQKPRLPFGVGEVLEYDIRVAFARGSARLEVAKLDTIRGRPAYHAQFSLRGGFPGFRVDEKYNSWIDAQNVSTLQYWEDVKDSFYERRRRYEFFPETRRFTDGTDTAATVERPIDQASVFYLIRTLNLRAGLDTNLNNYFQLDRNPIRIQVLARERIKVDAGTFDALVVRPVIKTNGLFGQGGDARVWISDDDRRIVLQIKANVPGPFGTLTLKLKNYRPPTR